MVQETQERKWWPADWADEWMPPARSTPDEFIVDANGHSWLGYAFDAKDATDHEKRYFSRALSGGDIVQFIYCDDLGELEIALQKDGAFEIISGAVDARANLF